MPPTDDNSKKRFPHSSIAQLLLLFLLVGLVLGTWLQTKREVETVSKEPQVLFCKTAPRVAILTPRQVRVIDLRSGKSIYSLSMPALNGMPAAHPVFPRDFAYWPSPRIANFTSLTATDFRKQIFGEYSEPAPELWDKSHNAVVWQTGYADCLFTTSGRGIVIETIKLLDECFEYLVIDLETGKQTRFKQDWRATKVGSKKEILDEQVIITSDQRTLAVIDPAKGPVEIPPALASRKPDSDKEPPFRLPAFEENGAPVTLEVTSHRSETWLRCRLGHGELSSWLPPKLLMTWNENTRPHWQTSDRAYLLVTGRFGLDRYESDTSPVWQIYSRPPFARRVPWPFAEGDIFKFTGLSGGSLGMVGQHRRQIGETFAIEAKPLYWEFDTQRSVEAPGLFIKTHQAGDLLATVTDTELGVVDLNSGKTLRTVALNDTPWTPQIIAWTLWIAAWTLANRRREKHDHSWRVGLMTAALFLGLMFWTRLLAQSRYQQLNGVEWIIHACLLSSLLIGLLVAALRRAAPAILLAVCSLIVTALLTSSILWGAEDFRNQSMYSNIQGSNASWLWKLATNPTRIPQGEPSPPISNSLLNSWLSPKITHLPPPQSDPDEP